MKSNISVTVLCALGLFGNAYAAPGASSNEARGVLGTNEKVVRTENTGTCQADNVLRALQNPDRAAVATSFCQTYINVPTSTGTITYTPILAGVKTVVATQTALYTETAFQTNTYTVTASATKTATVTRTVTRRRPWGKRTEVPIPPFLTQYPASRISSACSCLSVPPPSVVITVTGPPLVYWQTSTYYTTVSAPTTITRQTSVPTSMTVFTTVTTTVTKSVGYY